MKSVLPKVLHRIAGETMLGHVLARADDLQPERICIVYGHGGEQVREAIRNPAIHWAIQSPPLGTGHAVMQALPHLQGEGITLILYGDVPLITTATLAVWSRARARESLPGLRNTYPIHRALVASCAMQPVAFKASSKMPMQRRRND